MYFFYSTFLMMLCTTTTPKKKKKCITSKTQWDSTPEIEGVWDQSSGNIYSHLPMFTGFNAKFSNWVNTLWSI